MRMRPKQRVIVYSHGTITANKRAQKKAEKYRANSGREYFDCPGGCGKQVSLVNNKVRAHYSDQKNKTPCRFKGEL